MHFTSSYLDVIPLDVLADYAWRETRNAAKILASTNEAEFNEITRVLREFRLCETDITDAGGNESAVPKRLNHAFRELGWREGRHDTKLVSALKIMPYRAAGEKTAIVTETEIVSEGYKVDNVKGRVALDVEWHAKDGNLDRDVGAYRALYDLGVIDVGVIITRSHDEIRALAIRLGRLDGFKTTTTTSLGKLEPRMTRGDAGGCPLLAVAITDRCFRS
jgi:hypothetical protein